MTLALALTEEYLCVGKPKILVINGHAKKHLIEAIRSMKNRHWLYGSEFSRFWRRRGRFFGERVVIWAWTIAVKEVRMVSIFTI